MASQKTDEGVNPNIWIRPPETKTAGTSSQTKLVPEKQNSPKYATLEALTLRISDEDLEFLHKLERDIMRNRSPESRKERITKNTIIRAMLNCFRDVRFDRKEIPDEKELQMRLMKGIKDAPPRLF